MSTLPDIGGKQNNFIAFNKSNQNLPKTVLVVLFCICFRWVYLNLCNWMHINLSPPPPHTHVFMAQEIFSGVFLGQEVLADSCVYASGSQPTLVGGLIIFDRCKTCDCMTEIPLSAADDRVSVL